MPRRRIDADSVLDAALALAEEVGWPRVTARAIGARLGGGAELVLAHYRDLNAIANAWFSRALAQALAAPAEGSFPEQLTTAIGAWFDALAPHRMVSLAMLRGKLYPAHSHHWVPLIFNLSRLVHWLLDEAACPSVGRRRQAEEIAVSALLLAALREWQKGDEAAVRHFVAQRLDRLERRLDRLLPRPSGS